MINLDKTFLSSIGVKISDEHFTLLMEHIDGTLNQRIEDDIIHALSPDEIHELATLRNSNEGVVWQWLQANIPNLSDIVKAEVDTMLAEVVRNSDYL